MSEGWFGRIQPRLPKREPARREDRWGEGPRTKPQIRPPAHAAGFSRSTGPATAAESLTKKVSGSMGNPTLK
jgi:hypothetical protein